MAIGSRERHVMEIFQKKKDGIYIILGLAAVSMIVLPYLLLGKGSYVQVHDQMDGEILNYMYQAKYFLRGSVIPEFMNGMDKSAMLPPAPWGVLFYLILPPYWAFTAMQFFVLIVGFLGMYCLLRKMGIHAVVSLAVSVLFCYLPFYPTYGLASLGQPMLVLAVLWLLEEHAGRRKYALALGMLLLYAGFSSLTLIGYVWIGAGLVLTLWLFLNGKKSRAVRMLTAEILLTAAYLAMNLELLKSLFGGTGFVTHREEMLLTAVPDIKEQFFSLLFVGGSYSNVYSKGILAAAAVTFLLWFLLRRNEKNTAKAGQIRQRILWMGALLGLLLLGLIWAVLWNSAFMVNIRNAVGGMVTYFQADRVYWVFPFLWVLVLACILDIGRIWMLQAGKVWVRGLLLSACLLLWCMQGFQAFRDGTLNKNIRLLLVPGYEQITWESFYMEDVFSEMRTYMDDGDYSVVSLGMYPSIALYNGLTCADGYSNNYDLAYKHAFEEIMREEMAKNEAAAYLIEHWGNRLYLVSGQYGLSPLIGKTSGVVFEEVSYDTDAMKTLHIRYILAAGRISNAEEMGLTLVREEPFESDSSYFAIWLYEVLP